MKISKAIKYRKLIKERMPKIITAHDDTGHWYIYNGVKYPSVTGALRILKDEGLMNWKMNKALEYVKDNSTLNEISQTRTFKVGVLKEAKLAPVKEFEGAGDIGSQVHNWREKYFKVVIDSDYFPAQPLCGITYDLNNKITDSAIISGVRAIDKFLKETSYIPIACELYVADEQLGIAGTLDDIGIMDNKLVLVDLKTSNIGDKTSYFLQVALYYYMFRKLTGIRIKKFYILGVSKTNGTYKLIPIENMNQLIKEAKLLLKLNIALARITESKKKETIML